MSEKKTVAKTISSMKSMQFASRKLETKRRCQKDKPRLYR